MTTPADAIWDAEVAVSRDEHHNGEIPQRLDNTVEYVDDIDRLRQLKNEWMGLEYCFRNPLLSHNWFRALANAMRTNERPEIILVRKGGEVTAIGPFAYRGKVRRRLEILGSSVTHEPGGVLFTDEESLEHLWKSACDTKATVFLKGIRFGSPEARALEHFLCVKGIMYLAREETLPWVSTKGKWEEYEKQISSSRRSSFRRLRRMAESKGKLEFEAKAPTPDNVDEQLDEIFRVEASSWKGRTGTAMISYGELGTFFRDYSRLEAENGRLRLFTMKSVGLVVAGQHTVAFGIRLCIF